MRQMNKMRSKKKIKKYQKKGRKIKLFVFFIYEYKLSMKTELLTKFETKKPIKSGLNSQKKDFSIFYYFLLAVQIERVNLKKTKKED